MCSSSGESDLTESEDDDSSEFESDEEEEVVQFDVPFAALPSVQVEHLLLYLSSFVCYLLRKGVAS